MSYDPATYIEDIPVKISERFRAPRKVTLSTSCSHHLNTDILTAEYDVTMEIETSKYFQKLKNHKEDRLKLREVKIQQYEEEKERIKEAEKLRAQKLQEEENERIVNLKNEKEKLMENEKEFHEENEKSDISREISEGEDVSEETECSEYKDANEVHVGNIFSSEMNSSQKVENSNENPPLNKIEGSQTFHDSNNSTGNYVYNSIHQKIQTPLQYPTADSSTPSSYPPVLVPTQCSKVSYHKSPKNSSCSINFADFEGDASDPFDSVALKSINDMEELAQVLQHSNVKQERSFESDEHLRYRPTGNYQQQEALINGGYQYNPYHYMPYQQSNNYHINPSVYNQMSSYESKISPSPATMSTPLTLNSNPIHQGNSYQAIKYSQWNQCSNASNSSHLKTYNFVMPHPVLPSNASVLQENSSASTPIGPRFPSSIPAQVVGTNSSGANFQISDSVGKRQDLEDFYSRYYSNNKSLSSGTKVGDNIPTKFLQNSKKLSSSSSVPDLTAVEDNEVSNISFEKIDFKSPRNAPPRPSSTGGYETTHAAFESRAKSPQRLKNRLPDPFTDLTEDAQSLVQSMAEMGFPRTRVARAVQKLGTDHKKLLEVLLTLQSFQENGEDEYRAEKAFYYYMGEVDKVNEFLSASKSLMDLGFEEERVIEYLFKHQNDKDKCLEELIAQSVR